MIVSNIEKPLLAGVVGTPISHSLSPLIHGYWLRELGIKGYYIPIDVSRDNFPSVIEAFPKMGFCGINVTLPHKEIALSLCDSVSDQAALIGAVNTMTISGKGKIHGDNTDAYGFMQSLTDANPSWEANDHAIMVLGAGGASKAVVYALISAGAEEVHVVNRNQERAELLKNKYGDRIRTHDYSSLEDLIKNIGTIINTTSLGMINKPKLSFPFNLLKEGTSVVDLVYNPLETELLREAKNRNCIAIDGLGMLLNQAAQSFYHWFDLRPEVDNVLRKKVLSK